MARYLTLNTNSRARSDARECLDRIRSSISAAKFGYKIQALAAHVLLRLGYRIDAVNRSGHPDIVTTRGGGVFLFEVEAEVAGPRLRKLTDADFGALISGPNVIGYYALAVSFPTPYWILVPASKLAGRRLPSTNILLEALSDKEYSAEWTREHVRLLEGACRQIRLGSFDDLSQMALTGRSL